MDNIMEALAKALQPHLGGGPVLRADGTPDVTTYLYENGGLFGTCDADPTLINAMVGPFGYAGALRWVGSTIQNEIVDSISRIHSSGYAQSTDCADCGTPTIQKCAQTTCFGRICQGTEEMVIDRIGLHANVNVPTKAMFGNVTDPMGGIVIRQGQPITDLFALQVMAAAYNLRRRVGTLLWNGNPANNLGGYEEFTGFDLLINTGKTDARSGLACDALDSVIVNYGNNVVGAAGSPNIVSNVSAVVRSIRYRIMTAGLNEDAAAIDIVMHPTLWDCVASAWACDYGLQCNSFTQATLNNTNNDALAVAELRDRFIRTRRLPIDGREYPVYLDNGIAVTNRPVGNETSRCSSIYVITKSVPGIPAGSASPGGGIITWGEYQDFNATTRSVQQQIGSGVPFRVTDGGRFIVTSDWANGICFDVKTIVKPRIRMSMTQLAGRVTNVCCIPLGTYPDVTGSGGTYEVDGGPTTSPAAYLYGDCWPTHVGS